jgi:hypothetical protein
MHWELTKLCHECGHDVNMETLFKFFYTVLDEENISRGGFLYLIARG